MKKWLLAEYLIEAKKCVDSINYISENAEILQYIDLLNKVNDIKEKFYIKCGIVLENSVCKTRKKDICLKDEIVNKVFYERDKNSAHKDDNYSMQEIHSLEDLYTDLKGILIHIKSLCSNDLPVQLTLDFVPHDKELFRLVNGITKVEEDKINEKKYFSKVKDISDSAFTHRLKIANDISEIIKMSDEEKGERCILVKNGINFYESLQNLQDSFIKMNLMYGTDAWVKMNEKEFKKISELTELGCFDKFGIIQPPIEDSLKLDRVYKILMEE